MKMKYSTVGIFISVIERQIIKSRKHWLVAIFCVIALSLGIFFHYHLQEFKNTFINNLKGLYPEVFIRSMESYDPIRPNYVHKKETVELSSEFSFRFEHSSKIITLINIGKRSTSLNSPPPIIDITNIDSKNQNHIWVNGEVWDEITGSSDYDKKGIYLDAIDKQTIYCRLHRFDFYGDGGWVYIPAPLALRLGIPLNIISIYAKEDIDVESIRREYISNGFNPVYLWMDVIPFFSRVFYILLTRFFTLIAVVLSFLVISVSYNFWTDMVKEFKQMIFVLSFHGIKELSVQLFMSFFIFIYIIIILICGGFLAFILSTFAHAIPALSLLHFIDARICARYILTLALYGLPIFLTITYGFVRYKFKKGLLNRK